MKIQNSYNAEYNINFLFELFIQQNRKIFSYWTYLFEHEFLYEKIANRKSVKSYLFTEFT